MKPGYIRVYTGSEPQYRADPPIETLILHFQLPENCTLEEAVVLFREAIILKTDGGEIEWST